MLAVSIVFAFLVFLALLRFGVIVKYDVDGLSVFARLGMLSFKILPQDKKTVKPVKPKKKPKKEKKPGGLKAFLDMLPGIKRALGRLKRRLLIKNLTIHFTAAGDDPAKTAMSFGAANAVFGAIVPILENSFRIKNRDFRAAADFDSTQPGIYVSAAVSLAVWEAVYIVFALLPALIGSGRRARKSPKKLNVA